ncbi:unnamed protein product [Caenorhabditis nigoni]
MFLFGDVPKTVYNFFSSAALLLLPLFIFPEAHLDAKKKPKASVRAARSLSSTFFFFFIFLPHLLTNIEGLETIRITVADLNGRHARTGPEERKKKKPLFFCPAASIMQESARTKRGRTKPVPFLFLYFSLSFIFYSSDLPLSTPPTLRKTIVGSESMDEWSPSSRATILGRRHD